MKQARSKVPHNWGKMVIWVILLMGWAFVSLVASQIVVAMVLRAFLNAAQLNSPVWNAVFSVVSYGIALALVLLVPPRLAVRWEIRGKKRSFKGKPVTKEELGYKKPLSWTDIGLAPVGYIATLLLAAGLLGVFSLFPWFDATEVQQTGFSIYMTGVERVIAFIVLVVIAPVVEETIFRGWLYGKLRSRLAAPLSIILVSLLFGLVHFQWNVGVSVFALSVVACVLREITGTIWAGILTHMLMNGIAFYRLYVLGL